MLSGAQSKHFYRFVEGLVIRLCISYFYKR